MIKKVKTGIKLDIKWQSMNTPEASDNYHDKY